MRLPELVTLKKEIGPVEALSLLTAAAVAFAAIFNFGFFSKIDTSFVSVLTLQDLIIGAAVAFIPVAAIFEISFRLDRWLRKLSGTQFWLALIFVTLALSIPVIYAAYTNNSILTAIVFPLILGISAFGQLSDVIKGRVSGLLIVGVVGIFYNTVYTFGQALFQLSIQDYKSTEYEVTAGGTTYGGRVIRATSAYIFLYDGKGVIMLPNEKLTNLKKLSL